MPTIQAAARRDNIKKSINAYTLASIGTGLSIPVLLENQERYGILPARWVEATTIFGGQVSRIDHGPNNTIGAWEELYLNLNIFMRAHNGLQPIGIYDMDTLATNIEQLYDVPIAIPVRDYQVVGTPIVGNLTVREKSKPQKIETAPDSGIQQCNISVLMRYHAFTSFV